MAAARPATAREVGGASLPARPLDRRLLALKLAVDTPWRRSGDDVCAALGVDRRAGLDNQAAARRRQLVGSNRVGPARTPSSRRPLAAWARSPLAVVLAAAAAAAAALGALGDAVAVGAAFVVAVGADTLWRRRADAHAPAASGSAERGALVRRGGQEQTSEVAAIVPGDIVLLHAGDAVPADGRVLAAAALEVDESPLGGPAAPVRKGDGTIGAVAGRDRTTRANMVFASTVVTRGSGEVVVTATGARTEAARVAAWSPPPEPARGPWQAQLDRLLRLLTLLAACGAATAAAAALWRGVSPSGVAAAAVAVAVAAMPVALPLVAATLVGMTRRRLTARGTRIRRPDVLERLAAVGAVAVEATGGLTRDEPVACVLHYRGRSVALDAPQGDSAATGSGRTDLSPVLLAAALCNDAEVRDGRLVGEPVERALLALALAHGLRVADARRDLPRLATVAARRGGATRATLHRDGADVRVFAVGSPDAVLRRCAAVATADGTRPLDRERVTALRATAAELAAAGLRPVAVAAGRTEGWDGLAPTPTEPEATVAVDGLELLGVLGLDDPALPGARGAVARCAEAGIALTLLARRGGAAVPALARALGLVPRVLHGADIDRLGDAELAERLPTATVCAGTLPHRRLRVVEALRRPGVVVAASGDPAEDAAALRRADVGVARGAGDVLPEAVDVLLADAGLASLVDGIEAARRLRAGLAAAAAIQLAACLSVVLALLLAVAAGIGPVLGLKQVLWLTLVVAAAVGVTAAVAARGHTAMRVPPVPAGAPLLAGRRLARLAAQSTVAAVGTLAAVTWVSRSAGQAGVAGAALAALAAGLAAVTVTDADPAAARGARAAALVGVALQVAVLTVDPLAAALGVEGPHLAGWAAAAGVGLAVVLVGVSTRSGTREPVSGSSQRRAAAPPRESDGSPAPGRSDSSTIR